MHSISTQLIFFPHFVLKILSEKKRVRWRYKSNHHFTNNLHSPTTFVHKLLSSMQRIEDGRSGISHPPVTLITNNCPLLIASHPGNVFIGT
jgi:hypothetical protein